MELSSRPGDRPLVSRRAFTENTSSWLRIRSTARGSRAKRLIDGRQYVLESVWGDAQPRAEDENAFLESHSWDEYAQWHLGLTEEASAETKARYAFVYGDFRRLHRSGLIACQYRAAEWRHKDVELAAHRLLQLLDKKSAETHQMNNEPGGGMTGPI